MKKLILALTLLVSGPVLALFDTGKKPLVARNIQSAVKDKYIIWTTSIKKDTTKDEDPIVSQDQKGSVEPTKQAAAINVPLQVPQSALDFTSELPGTVAEVAGMINPKAGAVSSAVSFILNEGLSLASKKLTEAYGRSPYDLTVLQIAPAKYYRVVKSADNKFGKIEVTKDFKTDLKKWKAIRKNAIPVMQEYRRAVTEYNRLYKRYKANPKIESYGEEAEQYLNEKLQPLLNDKLRFEQQLKQYPLYRAAIMAVIPKEGKSCTIGSGPWQLHVFIYVGAKMTNKYIVDFCVKEKNKQQQFDIQILSDSHQAGTARFIPGGIRLRSADNITFPVFDFSKDKTNDASTASQLFDWYTEFLVDQNADTVDQYFFPFNIYKLEQEVIQKAQEKKLERRKEELDRLKKAIEKVTSSKGKDELENADSESSDSDFDFTSDDTQSDDEETDDSEKVTDDSDSDSSNANDDKDYLTEMLDIKTKINARKSNASIAAWADQEENVYTDLVDSYSELLDVQNSMIKQEVKPNTDRSKELLVKVNRSKTLLWDVSKSIKKLDNDTSKSSVKEALAEKLKEFETMTEELEQELKTGKKKSGGIVSKLTGAVDTVKKYANKAPDVIKDNLPSALQSFLGIDPKKKKKK